jgi:16S rRNA (cytosine1402-N4)-methyltransferase
MIPFNPVLIVEKKMGFHIPVLLKSILQHLDGILVKQVFDGTCGAAGHAKALLEAHPEITRYVASDQDEEALAIARKELSSFSEKVTFCHSNFSDISFSDEVFDVILLDLGVSSMQLDRTDRGFSFMREGPLDMRMNASSDVTAQDLVQRLDRNVLIRLFAEGGEERGAKRIADAIIESRRKTPIVTTTQLANIIARVVPRRGRLHPATLAFQALRIAVNEELNHLAQALPSLSNVLGPKGRFFVITFHSLEDKVVKQSFKALSQSGLFSLVVKKPIVPDRAECRANPRSRSAKLRILERNHTEKFAE